MRRHGLVAKRLRMEQRALTTKAINLAREYARSGVSSKLIKKAVDKAKARHGAPANDYANARR